MFENNLNQLGSRRCAISRLILSVPNMCFWPSDCGWKFLFHLGQELPAKADDAVAHANFVGSNQCAQCHATEHKDWLSSQHAVAMQEATEQTVLGRFDGGHVQQRRCHKHILQEGRQVLGPDRRSGWSARRF